MRTVEYIIDRWDSGWFARFLLSPLLVSLSLLLTDYLVSLGYPVVLAGSYFWLAATSMLGGIRASLLSASLIALYVGYKWDHYGFYGGLQVILYAYGIALAVGLLKHRERIKAQEAVYQRVKAEENQAKADFVDSINGNILILKELNGETVDLINNFDIMQRHTILEKLVYIQGKLVNVAQKAVGWHQLYLETQEVIKKDDLATKRLDN
jgi:hypothetical protein